MYADKGLAVLLLALSAAVAHQTGWPRSKQSRTYRPNMDPRRLIQHVMMHEVEWANVLKESVKVLGDSPHGGYLNGRPSILPPPKLNPVFEHGDDGKKETADIADTTASYTVRDIVATVVRHYIGVRSFVEYGAKAVRLATSCYAMRQSMFQFSTIALMMIKGHTALDVVAAVIELKKNAVAYIDVLASSPHENITALYNVYWRAVDVIQDKRIQTLTQIKYPTEMIEGLEKYAENLEKLVNEQCDTVGTQEEILRDMGIEQRPPLLSDSYLDILVQFKDLKHMNLSQTKHVDRYVKKLKMNTMPTRVWSSMFLSKGSLEETKSDLSETMAEVEKQLSEEQPAKEETNPGYSEESATELTSKEPV